MGIATVDPQDARGFKGTSKRQLATAADRILDLLPAAAYVCDADGMLARYNRRAAELWGRSPEIGDPEERFCGSHRMFRLDGDPVPHAECPMADVLRTGVPARDQEIVIERPDGSRVVALVNIDALMDDDGTVIGAVNCFQEITERKRAEAAQRESEQRFRDLLQSLPVAIYTTDAEGRITFFNQAAVSLAGRRPELGTDEFCVTWRLYWPDGRPMPHDECPMAVALKEDRAIRGAEAVAERPDGTRVPFIPYPTPLHDGSGNLIGAVNMLVDISDRKRAEEQQSLLVREMTHRIKNIFAVVGGMVTLSARAAGTTHDMAGAILGRLGALTRAHELTRPGLTSDEPDARTHATLHTLIRTIFSPYVGEEGSESAGRVIITGPDVAISGQAVTSLALLFHEFTTNATKYGPLSSAAGRVEIGCSLEQGDLVVSWKEHGGPPVVGPPTHEGFGTALTRRVVRSQLGGQLSHNWRLVGLTIRLSVPVARLTE